MVRFRVPALALATSLAGACAGPAPPASVASLEARPFEAAAVTPPLAPAGCETGQAPTPPAVFDERAIASLMTWVYRDMPVESYCGCAFGPDQQLRGDACGFAPDESGAPRIRWEPVVPPSRFGVYRRCWQQWNVGSGDNPLAIEKCSAADPEFQAMVTDLYNYHPVLEELSRQRADHPYAYVQGEPREFGFCDFETQSVMGKSLKVEPPPEVRGDLARIYLYMAARYGKGRDWKIKLSREQRLLYEQWAEADPVDDRERLRACRIAAIQGWDNPYVK